MIDRKYSVTRTRATWKPRVIESDLPFFQCSTCGNTYQGITGRLPGIYTGTGRTLVAEPPYTRDMHTAPSCCGNGMRPMNPIDINRLPNDIELDYRILGGYNNNVVECSWRITSDRYDIAWAALKTFTGTQMKYVLPGKRPPLLFALADEDAYVYCDESPCLECTFMCKRGFVLYVGITDLRTSRANPLSQTQNEDRFPLTSFIASMPMTRMSPYWESRD